VCSQAHPPTAVAKPVVEQDTNVKTRTASSVTAQVLCVKQLVIVHNKDKAVYVDVVLTQARQPIAVANQVVEWVVPVKTKTVKQALAQEHKSVKHLVIVLKATIVAVELVQEFPHQSTAVANPVVEEARLVTPQQAPSRHAQEHPPVKLPAIVSKASTVRMDIVSTDQLLFTAVVNLDVAQDKPA